MSALGVSDETSPLIWDVVDVCQNYKVIPILIIITYVS